MLSEKIEIFIEAADTLRFSAVAKKRYTTQPTISRQISALEEEWGVSLFVRTNKGLRLTPEGAIMLKCCKKMKQQCEQSLEQARSLNIGKQARIRLGFLETLDAERIFLPFVEDFSAEHKDLDISITYASFGKLRRGIESNELDVIYTLGFEEQNIKSDVVVNVLGDLKPWVILSKRHPLYEKPDLKLSDLADAYFYLPEASDSPGRGEELRMLLNSNGIGCGRIRYVSNMDSVLFQVKMGKGVALADSGTRDIRDAKYRTLELATYEGELKLISMWRKDNLNPFLSLFINQQTIEL